MSKAEIISKIAKMTILTGHKCTTAQVRAVLNCLGDNVHSELKSGNDFGIVGLGKFIMVKRNAKLGSNPSTGEPFQYPSRMIVKFLPSLRLKAIGKVVSKFK